MRNDTIYLKGDESSVRAAEKAIRSRLHHGAETIESVAPQKDHKSEPTVSISTPKRLIKAKSLGQAEYMGAIDRHDIVVSIGPAGTGKTYLAVAKAVSFLMEKRVERLILTRPAVEAGESLGFLPGAI